MARYAIWDKQSDIYTLGVDPETGKARWTAREYIERKAPWADIPGVKVVVSGGPINGAVFAEINAVVAQAKSFGVAIEDGMTDEEILAAIEHFEDHPPEPAPTPEERIAAMLEFHVMMAMPEEV